MSGIEELLQRNLTPMDEPDAEVNQTIKNKINAKNEMSCLKKRRFVTAAVCLVLLTGALTACTAWKYLKPAEVAELVKEPVLRELFSSKEAVLINETQSSGGYDVTLLGMVSGEVFLNYVKKIDGEWVDVKADKTYYILAVVHTDGTPVQRRSEPPFDEGHEWLYESPAVEGYAPWEYTMYRQGERELSQDGVMYWVVESDNLEVFADREVYICVNEGPYYEGNAFYYDRDTGKLSKNPSYEGLNALFILPLDKKKADPEAEEKLIQKYDGLREEYAEYEGFAKRLMENKEKNDAQR